MEEANFVGPRPEIEYHPTRTKRGSSLVMNTDGTYTHWQTHKPMTLAEAALEDQKVLDAEASALKQEAEGVAQRGRITQFFAWLWDSR